MEWEAQMNSLYYPKVKARNKLPKAVTHIKNINMFQAKLDEGWKDVP